MPTFTYRLEIDSGYDDETEEQIRDAIEEALRSLGEVGIKLTHIPEQRLDPMTWLCPIPYRLVLSDHPIVDSRLDETVLPMGQHPGAFGVSRRYEVHTGVDLYCPPDTPVMAVEDGLIVGVEWFTGPDADPPSPWWYPTEAVLVQGASGVVLYGDMTTLCPGIRVRAGDVLGNVQRVLRHDKGKPTSMLHLELHAPGTTKSTHPWKLADVPPSSLRDPTPHLMKVEWKCPHAVWFDCLPARCAACGIEMKEP